MTLGHLSGDPIDRHVTAALGQIGAGLAPDAIEHTHVDIKEEPGRRDTHGAVISGSQRNEEAAVYLAGEMACMANTPGGGAIVLGVADDGTTIGTELDTEWLRHRIWELAHRQLTAAIRAETVGGRRLLVLSVPEALEPISYKGRLRWRVGAHCVDVDPVAWRAQSLRRLGYDWSSEPSQHTLSDVRPTAVEIARRYLRHQDTQASQDLADARDHDMLTRLGLLDADGRLANAGSLLFVETPFVGIDYMRRDRPGGDSIERIEDTGPLVEQIWEAERAGRVANRTAHIERGFVHRQVRAIPERAFREAIVNGVTHRDWLVPHPTSVEHIGDTLTVTSPGGFIGGVSPDNAITHPAVPRYRRLSEALAALGLAERQGIGIDRMVAEMLSIGRPKPVIAEIDGPYVRVTLLGGTPDAATTELVSALEPPTAADVETLLLLEQLTSQGWTDAATAAPVLQRHPAEAAQAIARLLETRIDHQPVCIEVHGAPADQPTACRLSDIARERLAHRMQTLSTPEGRDALFLSWTRARGRISSTEAADLAGITPGYANRRLAALADEGRITPSRPNRTGRGFHYLPTSN